MQQFSEKSGYQTHQTITEFNSTTTKTTRTVPIKLNLDYANYSA